MKFGFESRAAKIEGPRLPPAYNYRHLGARGDLTTRAYLPIIVTFWTSDIAKNYRFARENNSTWEKHIKVDGPGNREYLINKTTKEHHSFENKSTYFFWSENERMSELINRWVSNTLIIRRLAPRTYIAYHGYEWSREQTVS